MTHRPVPSEYNSYYEGYVSSAGDDPIAQLEQQIVAFEKARGLDESAASTPPAPGEWTLKEVLVHLCDFERMFSYRALRFSRRRHARRGLRAGRVCRDFRGESPPAQRNRRRTGVAPASHDPLGPIALRRDARSGGLSGRPPGDGAGAHLHHPWP